MKGIWMIAAVSENNVIGSKNTLPWRIPADLARFKALTLGNTLVMGRRTFESIGRALPGRTTLVLTRQNDFAAPGVSVVHDRHEAISVAPGGNVFVAGGADVYSLFLPVATKLFLTRVHDTYEGDTYFPAFDPADWHLMSSEHRPSVAAVPSFTFQIYDRKITPVVSVDP